MKRTYKLIIGLLLCALAFEAVLYAGNFFPSIRHSRLINAAAYKTIVACSKLQSRSGCYDREIPKLMTQMSMEDTFAVTAKVQEEDPSYAYCHVLAHALSVKETQKDPGAWMDVVTRCPAGMCSNGCIHGAFQERFRSEILTEREIEELMPDLQAVCLPRDSWQPTGLEQGNCFHALGHLLMYITGADTPQAVGLCERLTDSSDTRKFGRVCYDGVFMQLYQPLEPEDRLLIRGKEVSRNSHEAFCRPWKGKEPWFSCWVEGWPTYLGELQNPDGFMSFCSYAPEAQQKDCAIAVTYVMAVQMQFDLERIADYCQGMSESWQTWCYAGVASRLIETDSTSAWKAAGWCAEVPQEQARSACYKEVAFSASFMLRANSPELTHLCSQLPAEWRDVCQNQQQQKEE